jgi:hypothetical protein
VDVKRVFETEDGDVHFHGTLTGHELEAVITVGLNTLLQNGALPYLMENEETAVKLVMPESKTAQ